MPLVRSVELAIVDSNGQRRGLVEIAVVPGQFQSPDTPALIDLRAALDRDNSIEPVQLLEGAEYRFRFDVDDPGAPIETDKPEVFWRDDESGRTGRLRPGLYTGSLGVRVHRGTQPVGRFAVEVRSRKLDYVQHYRWMLRDIAQELTELVMQRFAAAEQKFGIEDSREAVTSYQRFAFLQSLIVGEAFEAAIHQILSRPYVSWEAEEELRTPRLGIPASSQVARQLSSPGPRIKTSIASQQASLLLPALFRVYRTAEALDNAANRFAKFALTRWRGVVTRVTDALATMDDGPAKARGLREARALGEQLDALLGEELFREVGHLEAFPAGNQVLQKREGYRDLFRAYMQCELAAKLSWNGGEEVYGAGQRDVATLYEYWAFFQLTRIVATVCERGFDCSELVAVTEDGLGVTLRRGQQMPLRGSALRLGRRLRIELWFNRTFSSIGTDSGSWSRPMRPDCSLYVGPDTDEPTHFESVWLHFDAKYRVEKLLELFGPSSETSEEATHTLEEDRAAEDRGVPKRSDLLKMHAYKDAIRRSAGAYILYPGTDDTVSREYHEILPGLGAFSLRPASIGDAEGAATVRSFLDDVLSHVASQLTQHERARYWREQSYSGSKRGEDSVPAAPFIRRPPADTLVLLGYVKSEAHRSWINSKHRYNLRADGRTGSVGLGSRELAVELVALYGPSMDKVELWKVIDHPELLSRDEMLGLGYPGPRGRMYYCLRLAEAGVEAWRGEIKPERVREVRARLSPAAPRGAPVTASWLDLVR